MLTTEWGNVRYPSCKGQGADVGQGKKDTRYLYKGPGACPGGNAIHWGLRGANRLHPNEDKHQALIHTTPPLVPTEPWAASTSMDMITRFGRQHSLGEVTAGSAKTARV